MCGEGERDLPHLAAAEALRRLRAKQLREFATTYRRMFRDDATRDVPRLRTEDLQAREMRHNSSYHPVFIDNI